MCRGFYTAQQRKDSTRRQKQKKKTKNPSVSSKKYILDIYVIWCQDCLINKIISLMIVVRVLSQTESCNYRTGSRRVRFQLLLC